MSSDAYARVYWNTGFETGIATPQNTQVGYDRVYWNTGLEAGLSVPQNTQTAFDRAFWNQTDIPPFTVGSLPIK